MEVRGRGGVSVKVEAAHQGEANSIDNSGCKVNLHSDEHQAISLGSCFGIREAR